jgi:hypothetical protein
MNERVDSDRADLAEESATAAPATPLTRRWQRWAFAIVPLVGLVELVCHAWQTHNVASAADWSAARASVKGKLRPDDLLLFAPRWLEPLGRQHLGDDLATMERMTYADESRYARAIEVGVRGKRRPELLGWREVSAEVVGRITVTTYENPSPSPVVDEMMTLAKMRVSRVDAHGEQDCPLQRGIPQTSGTYYPPGVPLPGEKFVCGAGGTAAITIMPVLDYTLRRCIYAPPPQPGTKLRIRFSPVKMGHSIRGNHGLYAEGERDRSGPPVNLELRVGDVSLGSVAHRDGEGWRSFELDTSELAGQTVEVIADVSSTGHDRQYCFEVTTR